MNLEGEQVDLGLTDGDDPRPRRYLIKNKQKILKLSFSDRMWKDCCTNLHTRGSVR